jgi:hypothetical protein
LSTSEYIKSCKELKLMCSAWLGDREDPSLLKESGVNPTADYFLEEAENIMQKVYEHFEGEVV